MSGRAARTRRPTDRRLHRSPAARTRGRSRASRSSFASGIVISRSSVPVVRSRSIAIDVTRNIEMSGKIPTIGTPTRSNVPGWPSNTYLSSAISTHGTTSSSASVRGSRRSCSSTRRAVASVTRELTPPPPTSARNASSRSSRAGALAQLGRRRVGQDARRRASAAGGRSGRPRPSRGCETSSVVPRVGELAEQRPRGRAAAPGRGRRSARRARAARARRAARWPARRGRAGRRRGVPHDAVGDVGRGRPPRARGRRAAAARRGRGRSSEVLAHRQVDVDRRRLGHVADPPAQRRRPGRQPEHLDASRPRRSARRRSRASASTCRSRSARAAR